MSGTIEIVKVKLTNEIDIPFVGLGTFRVTYKNLNHFLIEYFKNRHF